MPIDRHDADLLVRRRRRQALGALALMLGAWGGAETSMTGFVTGLLTGERTGAARHSPASPTGETPPRAPRPLQENPR